MAEIKPVEDYDRVSDYLMKGLVGSSLGIGAGGIINKLTGKPFFAPGFMLGGGLIGGLGGLGVAHYKDLTTNRFAKNDFTGDNVYVMQMPLLAGGFPGANHTCVFATLTPESFEKLPYEEQKKWHCAERDGKTVWYRGITNSYGEKGRSLGSITGNDPKNLSASNRADAEYTIGNYIIRGLQPSEVKERAAMLGPEEWVNSRGMTAPTHIAELKLNPTDTPFEEYVNDMLNEGVDYINSRQLPYNMTGWNCHTGVVDALTHNSHVAPGYFSLGGLRGASGRTGEAPSMNMWSNFRVEQD